MGINIFDFKSTVDKTANFLTNTNLGKTIVKKAAPIIQTITPAPASPTSGRGATNLFADEKTAYDRMIKDGITPEIANKAITERRKTLLGEITPKESIALQKMMADGIDSKIAARAVTQNRYNKASPGQKIAKNILDLGASGSALMAEQLANVGSLVSGSDELRQTAKNIKDIRKNDFESTIGGKIGAGVVGAGEFAAVGPTKLEGALEGLITGAAMPVLEKGKEVTSGDITSSALQNAAIGAVAVPVMKKVVAPVISKGIDKSIKYGTALKKGGAQGLQKSVTRDISKIGDTLADTTIAKPKKLLTRSIPEKIVENDLGFTPTERAKIKKITGKTPAQYTLEKGYAGKGKEEAAQIFDKQASEMYNGITAKLKQVDTKVKSNKVTTALEDMLDQLTSKPKIAKAYAKDIEAIQSMIKKGEYSLDDVNNIRRAYDKVNSGIYTAKGEIRSGLEAQIDADIRKGLKELIEKEALKKGIDVKQMNKELVAGLEMKDALLRRMSQEERNNFFGLQDLGVSAILSGGDPVSAIATLGAKKYLKTVAPSVSQKVYNLNKTKYVPSNVNRGNTIINSNKSSKLGLASNNVSNMDSKQVTLLKSNKPKKKLLKKN